MTDGVRFEVVGASEFLHRIGSELTSSSRKSEERIYNVRLYYQQADVITVDLRLAYTDPKYTRGRTRIKSPCRCNATNPTAVVLRQDQPKLLAEAQEDNACLLQLTCRLNWHNGSKILVIDGITVESRRPANTPRRSRLLSSFAFL